MWHLVALNWWSFLCNHSASSAGKATTTTHYIKLKIACVITCNKTKQKNPALSKYSTVRATNPAKVRSLTPNGPSMLNLYALVILWGTLDKSIHQIHIKEVQSQGWQGITALEKPEREREKKAVRNKVKAGGGKSNAQLAMKCKGNRNRVTHSEGREAQPWSSRGFLEYLNEINWYS